jgi:hypothetical protein
MGKKRKDGPKSLSFDTDESDLDIPDIETHEIIDLEEEPQKSLDTNTVEILAKKKEKKTNRATQKSKGK